MEDEEFIRKTLENIINTQAEIEKNQTGIAAAIGALQKRIKNNKHLEAWEAARQESEIRHREHRIKKYTTDNPSFNQLYGTKRKRTIGYDERGEVVVEVPYYTCMCIQVDTISRKQTHEPGCPFRIMKVQPKRRMSVEEINKILDEVEKRSNGEEHEAGSAESETGTDVHRQA